MLELDNKESWAPKNWCFWTVVLEETLYRVPWTARRSNQFILKGISHEYSLEGLMLKLKRQCFAHLMGRTNSLGKTLMLGMIEGRRRKGLQRMKWFFITSRTQWTWMWAISGSWWWTGKPAMLQSIGSQRVRHDWATKLNWTDHTGNKVGAYIISYNNRLKSEDYPCFTGRISWWFNDEESTHNAGDSADVGSIPGLGNPLEGEMVT